MLPHQQSLRPAAQVYRHKYAEATARLNNRDIFGKFVLEWIASSSNQLSLRCRRLEQGAAGQHGWQEFASDGASGQWEAACRSDVFCRICSRLLAQGQGALTWCRGACPRSPGVQRHLPTWCLIMPSPPPHPHPLRPAGKNKVAGLVEDMLNAVQSEMGRYQRIITYWPMYGPDLERAVTGALREATMGVSRQCGLVQIKVRGGMGAASRAWGSGLQGAVRRPPSCTRKGDAAAPQCRPLCTVPAWCEHVQLSSPTFTPPCHPCLQESGQSPDPQAVQLHRRQHSGSDAATAQRGGRTAWRWVLQGSERAVAIPATYRGAPMVLQQGINPNQALLLNSLRRLLQVSPQMEQELKRWCAEPLADSMAAGLRSAATASGAAGGAERGGSARQHREAPNLGAQFAQLVKELRSEYFAAITLCAERLACELAKMPATSVVHLLRRDGVFASTQQLSASVGWACEGREGMSSSMAGSGRCPAAGAGLFARCTLWSSRCSPAA